MSSKTRREWLASLAALTYPASPGQAASAFAAYLPMLADLPDAAFTPKSLEFVVRAPRRMAMPSYDEVRTSLSDWWRDNRPRVPALPEPAPVRHVTRPPTAEEVAKVAASMTQWRQHCASRAQAEAPGGLDPDAWKRLPPDDLRQAYRERGLPLPAWLA